jgi:hypothetical protein
MKSAAEYSTLTGNAVSIIVRNTTKMKGKEELIVLNTHSNNLFQQYSELRMRTNRGDEPEKKKRLLEITRAEALMDGGFRAVAKRHRTTTKVVATNLHMQQQRMQPLPTPQIIAPAPQAGCFYVHPPPTGLDDISVLMPPHVHAAAAASRIIGTAHMQPEQLAQQSVLAMQHAANLHALHANHAIESCKHPGGTNLSSSARPQQTTGHKALI